MIAWRIRLNRRKPRDQNDWYPKGQTNVQEESAAVSFMTFILVLGVLVLVWIIGLMLT